MIRSARYEWTFCSVFIVTLTVIISNAAFSSIDDVGAPYTASIPICDQYVPATKGQYSCSHWATASETRQDTLMTGVFWNETNYRIVK